jgi:hypothetical protein
MLRLTDAAVISTTAIFIRVPALAADLPAPVQPLRQSLDEVRQCP